MTNALPILDVLWNAGEGSLSVEDIEAFDKSYVALRNDIDFYSKPFSLSKKFSPEVTRFLDGVGSLEVMLGLNGIHNTSVVFDRIDGVSPNYLHNNDDIYLTFEQNQKRSDTYSVYHSINPSATMQERELYYDNFLKQSIPSRLNVECESLFRLKDKEEFDSLRKKRSNKVICTLNEIILIKPRAIGNRQFEEGIPYYYCLDDDAKCYFFRFLRSTTFTYNQPSSNSVARYIRLRKYSLEYMKKQEKFRKEHISKTHSVSSRRAQPRRTPQGINDVFPKENELSECLEWIKHVLQMVESDNKQQIIMLKRPSYETIIDLSELYPNISKVIDFYDNKLMRLNKEVVEHGGYKTFTEKKPLICALEDGLKILRSNIKSYYMGGKYKEFLSETDITNYLNCHINNINSPVRAKVEVEDGKSKIDLLLSEDGQTQDLAVEAKIAYKQGKFQTTEVKKALFTQMTSYGESVNRSSCAILYAFDIELADVIQRVSAVVLKEPKWKLSLNKQSDKTHYKLKKMIPDIGEFEFDVFVVCLHSESNTKKADKKNN